MKLIEVEFDEIEQTHYQAQIEVPDDFDIEDQEALYSLIAEEGLNEVGAIDKMGPYDCDFKNIKATVVESESPKEPT